MVNINAEIDLLDCLWSEFGSSFLNDASSIGVDFDIDLDADGVPYLMMDTGREDIEVDFQTRELTNKYDIPIGWEFIPVIHTDAVDSVYDLDTCDKLHEKFTAWNNIIELCKQIYEVEFYPNNYIDESEETDV